MTRTPLQKVGWMVGFWCLASAWLIILLKGTPQLAHNPFVKKGETGLRTPCSSVVVQGAVFQLWEDEEQQILFSVCNNIELEHINYLKKKKQKTTSWKQLKHWGSFRVHLRWQQQCRCTNTLSHGSTLWNNPQIPSTGACQPHPPQLQLTVCIPSCIYSGNEARGTVKQHVCALFYSENLEIRPSSSQQAHQGFRERPQIFYFPFAAFSIFLCSFNITKKKKKNRTELMGKCLHREMNDGVF